LHLEASGFLVGGVSRKQARLLVVMIEPIKAMVRCVRVGHAAIGVEIVWCQVMPWG